MGNGNKVKRNGDGCSGWGSVDPVRDARGRVVAWEAWYPSPADGSRVSERFGYEDVARARLWLERERQLVVMAGRGFVEWVRPGERPSDRVDPAMVTLEEFVLGDFLPNYRMRNGLRPRGITRNSMTAACGHFLEALGGIRVRDLTPSDIQVWYDAEHPEGAHAFYNSCLRLKQALDHACRPSMDRPALRDDNPFTLPMPSLPESPRRDRPPLTRDEFERIVAAMPDYLRIAPYLSVMVGGLRAGEVCGLRVGDIDFDAGVLSVRHSVNRGPDARGANRLAEPKTRSSRRTVPIPTLVMGLLREHIDGFCDKAAGGEAMVLRPKRTEILSPNVLQGIFRRACREAGVEGVTFHALRAAHATSFMLNGGTLRETMDELGHVSPEVAIRHYQRIVPEHRTRTANLVAFDFMPACTDPEYLRMEIGRVDAKLRELAEARRRLVALLGGDGAMAEIGVVSSGQSDRR